MAAPAPILRLQQALYNFNDDVIQPVVEELLQPLYKEGVTLYNEANDIYKWAGREVTRFSDATFPLPISVVVKRVLNSELSDALTVAASVAFSITAPAPLLLGAFGTAWVLN